jgi:hypothetical protein
MTPEGKVKKQILDYLKSQHILHRVYGAQANAYGFPDIDVWYGGTYIGVEVKAQKGVATLLQENMADAIKDSGCYHVFAKTLEDLLEVMRDIDENRTYNTKTLPKANIR